MLSARILFPLGMACLVTACVAEPPPTPMLVVLPGTGRSLAAFQQDDAICYQHAVAHTGYQPVAPAAGSAGNASDGNARSGNGASGPVGTSAGLGGATAIPTAGTPVHGSAPDEAAYAQCMASRGDTVKLQPQPYDSDAYDYGYPYSSAYPYGITYPYGLNYPYSAGYPYGYGYGYGYPGPFLDDGFYGGFGWGGYGGWWHGGRWGRGYGHGFGRGGFGRGGFGHGGFGHGGFGHGGGHGGGGHR